MCMHCLMMVSTIDVVGLSLVGSGLLDSVLSRLRAIRIGKTICQTKALQSHWEGERQIDPDFVAWVEAEGIDLLQAIPFRVYGDGATSLRSWLEANS